MCDRDGSDNSTGFTLGLLARDLLGASKRLCEAVTQQSQPQQQQQSAEEAAVVELCREAACRCQLLVATAAAAAARPGAQPPSQPLLQRVAATQTRLSALVDAAKRAFFAPFELCAAQDVVQRAQKLDRSAAKLLALAAPQATAASAELRARASGVAHECVAAFRAVRGAAAAARQEDYVAALHAFAAAFNAAVALSEGAGLGAEAALRHVAMRVGVLSRAVFLNPGDAAHRQELALAGRDVSHSLVSLLSAAGGGGGCGGINGSEFGSSPSLSPSSFSPSLSPCSFSPSPASSPPLPVSAVPHKSVSEQVLSPRKRSSSGGSSRPSDEIVGLIRGSLPSAGRAFDVADADTLRTLYAAIDEVVLRTIPPPSTPPPPPAPSSRGPKLPVARTSSTGTIPAPPPSSASSKTSRSDSLSDAALARVPVLAKIASPPSSTTSPPRVTSPRSARTISRTQLRPQLSLEEVYGTALESVDQFLHDARSIAEIGNQAADMQAGASAVAISNARDALIDLVEALVRHTVMLIPRCTSITRGFSARDAMMRQKPDSEDFDGQPTTITKVEFLGVSLLERARSNTKKRFASFSAAASVLQPDAAVLAAAIGPEAARLLALSCRGVLQTTAVAETLFTHLKNTVSQMTDDTIELDIQGAFELGLCGVAAITALINSLQACGTSTETLRCIRNSRRQKRLSVQIDAELQTIMRQAAAAGPKADTALSSIWHEHTQPLMEGPALRAGTLNHIVQRVTSDDAAHESEALHALITMHKLFCTSQTLLSKLVERYNVPAGAVAASRVPAIKLRVGVVAKTWIEMQFSDFSADGCRLLSDLEKLIAAMKGDGHERLAVSLEDAVRKQRDIESMKPPPPPPPAQQPQSPPMSFEEAMVACNTLFAEANEADIAAQLTLVDAELFRQVRPSELVNQNWNRRATKHESPTVLAIIARSNHTALWVATTVLSQLLVSQRAKVVSKFIVIAEHLRKLQNFNSLMGVLAGLTMSPVARLNHTFSSVKAPHLALFEQLQELMNPTGSFKAYRDALRQCSGMTLPYLGTYLSDLTFLGDGNPDLLDGPDGTKLINFKKHELVWGVIGQLRMHVQGRTPIAVKEPLHSALQALPYCVDDVLFEISVQLEPRNSRRADLF